MKLHLIKEKTIRDFVIRHSGSKASLEEWLTKAKLSDWKVAENIKAVFPSADLLGNGSFRVIFNIAGNDYCKYAFGKNEVHLFVCWIGTHAQHDKLCKDGRQYTIYIY